jgi:hypothetical protein
MDCVPKFIGIHPMANFYDIFLYIIGVKDHLHPEVEKHKNSIRNSEHARNILYRFYLEKGGEQIYKLFDNNQQLFIPQFASFIINAMDIEKIHLNEYDSVEFDSIIKNLK